MLIGLLLNTEYFRPLKKIIITIIAKTLTIIRRRELSYTTPRKRRGKKTILVMSGIKPPRK